MNSSEGMRLEHKSLPSYLPCRVGDLSGEQWWEVWGNIGFDRKSVSQGKWCEVKEGFSLERWKGVLTKTQFILLPVIGPASMMPDSASLIWICLLDLGGWKLTWAWTTLSELFPLITDKQETNEKRITMPLQGLWRYLLRRWPVIICRMHGAFSLNFFFELLCFYFWLLTGSQIPDQGLNLCPCQWKRRVLNTGLQGILCISWSEIRFVAQMVKNLPAVQETWFWSLDQEDPLQMGMATCASILAWRISWTEEPGGLQSMDCKESDTAEQLTLLLSYFWPETNMIIFAREFW